jgi:hypothetical protein
MKDLPKNKTPVKVPAENETSPPDPDNASCQGITQKKPYVGFKPGNKQQYNRSD